VKGESDVGATPLRRMVMGWSVHRGSPGRHHSKAVTALLFQALLLAVLLGYGPRRYSASGAAALPDQQDDEVSYYGTAYTVLNLSPDDLLADFPELQGMEPAAGQEQLRAIMGQVGASVEKLYQSMTTVAADEQITQEQCDDKGKATSSRDVRFGYLIIVDQGPADTIEEYRTDAGMKPVEGADTQAGFNDTNNFASLWLIFHPDNLSGTNFRYLGQQDSNGRNLYVVGFAEKPGRAAVKGEAVAGGGSAVLLYQGLAWIDASNFRIVKMRIDLLAPRLDFGLERSTTEIQFGEVRIAQAPAVFWLPKEVTVTTIYYGKLYRNRHVYSNFRLFSVKSTIKPLKPRQPPGPN